MIREGVFAFLMLGHSRPDSIGVLGGRIRRDVDIAGISGNVASVEVEGGDDGGVVGLGVFVVGGEGEGVVVEDFVVDL